VSHQIRYFLLLKVEGVATLNEPVVIWFPVTLGQPGQLGRPSSLLNLTWLVWQGRVCQRQLFLESGP
jgi:hypothetical protein